MSRAGKYEWTWGDRPPIINAHSLAKHEVLARYIARYMHVRTQVPGQDGIKITLVDGFAGGGRYIREDNGAVHPGSPLLMMQAMREADAEIRARKTKPFKLDVRYVFVEQRAQNATFLRNVLREEGHGGREEVAVIEGAFQDKVQSIIADILSRGRAGRSIFVLDQYGYSDVPLATIRDIFAKLPQAEVVLTFATDWLIDPLANTPSHQKALAGLGVTPAELLEHKDGPAWRRQIELRLHSQLQTTTGAKFYTPFFVVSPDAHRSYWLVHLSGHRKARDVMAQLHWEMHNHFAHYAGAGLDMFRATMLGYSPRLDPDLTPQAFLFDANARCRTEAELMNDIPPWLADNPLGVTFNEFFEQIVNGTPASSDILKASLVRLADVGEVEIFGPEGGSRRRHDRVSDHDRICLKKQRVLFGAR